MQEIKILDRVFKVENHWHWKQYKDKLWEPQTLETYKQVLNKDTIYIDLGAWLGITLFYADLVGCKELYGVEANPVSFELLKKNCSNNNINVKLDNLCINSYNGTTTFGCTNGVQTSSNSSIKGNEFLVQCKTLRDYLQDKPKENLFVKIDIEGAEELILDDLKEINGYIYLSIHVPFIKNLSEFYDKLCTFNVLCDDLKERIFSKEEFPSWGTSYGNFFEVLIDNRKH